jgi:type II secretory pathway component PulF
MSSTTNSAKSNRASDLGSRFNAPIVPRSPKDRRAVDRRNDSFPERRPAPPISRSSVPKKRGKALSKRELLTVVTQLSIMMRSSVDLADAVKNISQRSKNPRIREALGHVYSALERGCKLSDAMADQRHSFGTVMVATVAAGEAAGRLPDVLNRLTTIIKDELRMQGALKSAISYPLVLIGVTSLVMVAMVFFVLPQFAGIYASSEATVPFSTQIMLDGAKFAKDYWWAVAGGVGLVAVFILKLFHSESGREKIDRWILRLPYLKQIASPILAGRQFRLQGAMLESGVPVLDVLQLTRQSVGNSCFAQLSDQVSESVINGRGVADALRQSPIIPDSAADMIFTGESNGQLGSVMQMVGEYYESEGEQRLRDAVKIVEPAIIVGLGLVIGAIVLAVMLPLLDLSTARGM